MKRFLDVLLQFLFGLALPMLAWVIFGKTVARIGEPDVFDGFEWQAIGMGVMAIVGFAVARRLNAKESSAWMVTTNFMVNLVRGTSALPLPLPGRPSEEGETNEQIYRFF